MNDPVPYAIIDSGGKQVRVQAGDIVDLELLDLEKGSRFESKAIFFVTDGKKVSHGAPFVSAGKVLGEVIGAVRGPKVISYKYKKRKNYRRKVGHRQDYTRVKITEVGF